MFNMLHKLISKTLESMIPMQKGMLTNVLTCFRIPHKKVHLLQTKTKFLSGQLTSFNDDTKEQEKKLVLVDCELQSFSFDEVNVALTDDIENKMDKLKVQHKDRVENIDNFVRLWEELQFKKNKYGLGYEKDHDNLFCKFLIIVN
jgi:hypothetical protein